MRIFFPAEQITSAAFGGPYLDELYVTTAAQEITGPQPEEAGHLYRVRGIGSFGYPGVNAFV